MATSTKDTYSAPSREPVHKEAAPVAAKDVEPVVNEQMTRSRQIEAMGVEAWKATQDQRPIEEQPVIVKNYIAGGDVLNTPMGASKQVTGISHPTAPLPERAPVR